jgi:hypothetical protein
MDLQYPMEETLQMEECQAKVATKPRLRWATGAESGGVSTRPHTKAEMVELQRRASFVCSGSSISVKSKDNTDVVQSFLRKEITTAPLNSQLRPTTGIRTTMEQILDSVFAIMQGCRNEVGA